MLKNKWFCVTIMIVISVLAGLLNMYGNGRYEQLLVFPVLSVEVYLLFNLFFVTEKKKDEEHEDENENNDSRDVLAEMSFLESLCGPPIGPNSEKWRKSIREGVIMPVAQYSDPSPKTYSIEDIRQALSDAYDAGAEEADYGFSDHDKEKPLFIDKYINDLEHQ